MKWFLSFISVIAFASCAKTVHEEPSIWVNAIVFNTKDINCGIPVLDFSEDSIKVRMFTGERFLKFVVKGFPELLNIRDQKVRVQIATLKPEETFPCITLGPTLPAIKALNAKPGN